jgi:hypothetical protein
MGFGLILILVLGIIGVVVFMPVHLSGSRNLAVLLVGGGTANIGLASSDALVHYADGSTQNVTGTNYPLFPYLQSQSGVTLQGSNPTSADFQAKVYYTPLIDLTKYCATFYTIGNIPVYTTCPLDAVLIVETDLAITVNGQVVTQSSTNGLYEAVMSTGKVKAISLNPFNFASYFIDPSKIQTYDAGTPVTRPFSFPNLDLTTLRQQTASVTVSLTGKQIFGIFPVFDCSIIPLLYVLNFGFCPGGGVNPGIATFFVDGSHPIADPTDQRNIITYNDPTFQLPPLTVTTPGYSLSTSPNSFTISTNPVNNGNLAYLIVAALGFNGITGTFHVAQPAGLPSGVTAGYDTVNDPPVPATGTPLVSVRLIFTAANSAKAGNYTLTIQTNIGSTSHSVTVPITVTSNPLICAGGAAQCGGISTTLTASIPASIAQSLPFTITGKLATSSGGGVVGETISAVADWGATGTGVTQNDGSYSLTMSAPSIPGAYSIALTFAGDSQYSPSKATVRFAVRQPTLLDYAPYLILGAIILIAIVVGAYMLMRKKPGMP